MTDTVPTTGPTTPTTSTTRTTTTTHPTPTMASRSRDELRPAADLAPASVLRQLRALAGAEWHELLRNKVALFNSIGLPLLLGMLVLGIDVDTAPMGVFFAVMVTGTAILFIVYYTLVTAVVARREALQLKRLRSGEAGDVTILAGIAVPFVVVTLVQFALATTLARVLFDAPLSWPLLVPTAVGVVLAALAFAVLAVASTPVTKTVEHAQITTLPVIMIPLLLSGMALPLSVMPDAMRAVAQLLPLTPVVELIHLGLGATTVTGEPVTVAEGLLACVRPLLVLAGWGVIGALVARRTMVWEPRS